MGTMTEEFATDLYTFMALKFKIPNEDTPELYTWPSVMFTSDIAHAVVALSNTCRPVFQIHFKSIHPLFINSNLFVKLYTVMIAKKTYRHHSPYKILIICTFISEIYLFLFQLPATNADIQQYVQKTVECFNVIYRRVLSEVDDPVLKWDEVKFLAKDMNPIYDMVKEYDVLKRNMDLGMPKESIGFFESVNTLSSFIDRLENPGIEKSASDDENRANAFHWVETLRKRLFPPLALDDISKFLLLSTETQDTPSTSKSTKVEDYPKESLLQQAPATTSTVPAELKKSEGGATYTISCSVSESRTRGAYVVKTILNPFWQNIRVEGLDVINTGKYVQCPPKKENELSKNELSKKAKELSKQANELSKKATELSRKATELSRKANQLSRKANQPSKKANQPSKKEDESAKKENVSSKKENDSSKKENDSAKKEDESAKKEDESVKKEDDSAKKDDDSAKKDDDSAKKEDDSAKKENESSKKTNKSSKKRRRKR